MRVLDLFCGAGGAAWGYTWAGAHVVGVDLEPQPHFPFAFLQTDALALDVRFLRSFDLIHAAPPCQAHTALKSAPGHKEHEDLIPPTRALLKAAGVPWVIENVPGAPLENPTVLCVSMFGLSAGGHQLQRHRLFEASFPLWAPACRHTKPVIGVYGGHVRCRAASAGGRGTKDFVGQDKKALAMEAMGLPPTWDVTMDEISQMIPPAYSRHIAECFAEYRKSPDAGAAQRMAFTMGRRAWARDNNLHYATKGRGHE